MGQIFFQRRSVINLSLVIFLAMVWAGCSTTVKERQQGQPVTGPEREIKAEGEGMGGITLTMSVSQAN